MKFLRKKLNYTVALLRNLHPSQIAWGVVRPRNVFETSKEAMFAQDEPRDRLALLANWKARRISHDAAQNSDREFYALLDNLSDQIAVCQGLRASRRFGSSSMQARIMRAEDRLQSAMELLYSVRPDDDDYLKRLHAEDKQD